MEPLVECVPNFSEGRNSKIIDALTKLMSSNPSVHLLNVDVGYSTNRTVFTLVGQPQATIEVMLSTAKAAFELIDMRHAHKGEHKRLGALDVCPFVPVRGLTLQDCADLARQMGKRLADELSIPVYLYGEAAAADYRRQVPQIRQGEYEALAQRLQEKEWRPDFGPASFIPSWGATMVGARSFLIAYNINLLCTRNQANHIAFNVREQGRSDGTPGRLKHVQAMGWMLEEAGLAQVTVNILNHHDTPLHRVWTEVVSDAKQLRLPVFGSEIVGVVPLDALLAAADYFIQEEDLLVLGEQDKIRLAVHKLGLNYLSDFNPKERVIEYILRSRQKCDSSSSSSANDAAGGGSRSRLFCLDGISGLQFGEQSLRQFVLQTASREPVPGGGSISAAFGSFGAALAVMVGRVSSGCVAYKHNEDLVRKLLPPLHDAIHDLLLAVDHDSDAFTQLQNVHRSKSFANEKDKAIAIQSATKHSIDVPLSTATKLNSLWDLLAQLKAVMNKNASSDLFVAGHAFYAAIHGSLANVEINIDAALELADPAYVTQIRKQICEIRSNTQVMFELLTQKAD